MKEARTIIFLLHLAFGLYFINIGFNYVAVPEVISNFEAWIILIGGVLVLLGGINYLRIGKRKRVSKE
ncbi:MAG: hypothetical protein PVJ67_04680 [Candidatus Pacearchaeota archaeon]|jgi:hypothetical protein